MYFSVSYNCWLVLSYIFYLFGEDFTVFTHFTLEFEEYLYDCYFKLFIRLIAYLCFIKIFFRAYVSLFGFEICSFVSSLAQLSVCLNVLGETAVSLSLKGVCFIRYDPVAWQHGLPWPPEPGAHRLSLMWTVHALQLWWDLCCFVGRVEYGALVLMLEIHFESLHVTVVYSDVIAFF